VATIRDNTGFEFDAPSHMPETPEPDTETLALLHGEVGRALAETYPEFAARVLGQAA
jgi:glutaconate CoA-transferase subunit B